MIYLAALRAADRTIIARKARGRPIEPVARDWRGDEPFVYAICARVYGREFILREYPGTLEGLTAAIEQEQTLMTTETTTPALRTIRAIALDIARVWPSQGKGVNYAAAPYLDALRQLNTCADRFYGDSAESCILYFLRNASTFRGPDAKRLKDELKAHLPKRGK